MASTTTNMGLRSWDSSGDNFSYTELAANWGKVDAHDHTAGKGVQIPTAGIANLAITAAKLASGSIDSTKISAGSINFDRTSFKSGWQAISIGTVINLTTSYQNIISTTFTPTVNTTVLALGMVYGVISAGGGAKTKIVGTGTGVASPHSVFGRVDALGGVQVNTQLSQMGVFSIPANSAATLTIQAAAVNANAVGISSPSDQLCGITYLTLG